MYHAHAKDVNYGRNCVCSGEWGMENSVVCGLCFGKPKTTLKKNKKLLFFVCYFFKDKSCTNI